MAAYLDTITDYVSELTERTDTIRAWRWMAAGALGLAALGFGYGFHAAGQQKLIPYIVEVDRSGYALAVSHPLTPATMPDLAARAEIDQLWLFLREAREVTADLKYDNRQLWQASYRVEGAAKRYLSDYHATHNPIEMAQKRTIMIEPIATLPVGPHHFQPRWLEKAYDLKTGELLETTTWQADITTRVGQLTTDSKLEESPIDFHVTNLSWTQELETAK